MKSVRRTARLAIIDFLYFTKLTWLRFPPCDVTRFSSWIRSWWCRTSLKILKYAKGVATKQAPPNKKTPVVFSDWNQASCQNQMRRSDSSMTRGHNRTKTLRTRLFVTSSWYLKWRYNARYFSMLITVIVRKVIVDSVQAADSATTPAMQATLTCFPNEAIS